MRNELAWRPSKYERRHGLLRASTDVAELGVGSRLVADLIASAYDEAIPHHARGDLLDLGCGKVPLYATYRPHVASVTCVDWPGSVHGMVHLDVAADLSAELPFVSHSFDTLILSDVLEHIPRPRVLLTEMRRVLRPGGLVLMSVPFMYGIHEAPHDHFRYTRFALRTIAEESGFEVLELVEHGGPLDVITDIASKMLSQVPVAGRPIAAASQACVRALGRTAIGSKIRRQGGRHFPLFYFCVLRPV
jgi:SAM-dependent methyltransferase